MKIKTWYEVIDSEGRFVNIFEDKKFAMWFVKNVGSGNSIKEVKILAN